MNAGRHIALQHICIITHRVLLVCTCLLERAAQVLDLLLGALNQADYHEVSISKDAGLRVILWCGYIPSFFLQKTIIVIDAALAHKLTRRCSWGQPATAPQEENWEVQICHTAQL
jgi:hypothetical protein